MSEPKYTQYDDRLPESLRRKVEESYVSWLAAGQSCASVEMLLRMVALAAYCWDERPTSDTPVNPDQSGSKEPGHADAG